MEVFYASVTNWNDIRQRSQHLAISLAKQHQIVYCCPLTISARKNSNVYKGEAASLGIHLLAPTLLPVRRFSVVRSINRWALREQVRVGLRKRQFIPRVVWLSDPNQEAVLSLFPDALVIYDCQDDYPHFYADKMRQTIKLAEDHILQRADLVFTISQKLALRLRKQHSNVHLVPNGVDAQHFRLDKTATTTRPREIAEFKRPVIGYYGTVNWWFDWPTVRTVAELRPDWSFVIIGPTIGHVESYPPNIHMLGPKRYEELPFFLNSFDVAIMPFIDHEMVRSVDPLKIYEYMAAEKAIVASRLPAIEQFASVIHFYTSVSDFVVGVESWLQEPPSALTRMTLRAYAETNSWEKRTHDIRELMAEAIANAQ